MDLGIKGRRAIVTGGSSGIGYETARLFLEEGVRVLITGRDSGKLDKARDELAKKTGGEVYAIQADMRKEVDIKRMVDAAKEKLGGVDILVNNAGTMYSGRFAVIDDDEMKQQLDTKLFGFMRAIRLVYPMMKAQKWGRIVNTIGGAGKEPDLWQRHDQCRAAQPYQIAIDRAVAGSALPLGFSGTNIALTAGYRRREISGN
jgi:3-oxoacyl-[acyl-carrier protein] reductase